MGRISSLLVAFFALTGMTVYGQESGLENDRLIASFDPNVLSPEQRNAWFLDRSIRDVSLLAGRQRTVEFGLAMKPETYAAMSGVSLDNVEAMAAVEQTNIGYVTCTIHADAPTVDGDDVVASGSGSCRFVWNGLGYPPTMLQWNMFVGLTNDDDLTGVSGAFPRVGLNVHWSSESTEVAMSCTNATYSTHVAVFVESPPGYEFIGTNPVAEDSVWQVSISCPS